MAALTPSRLTERRTGDVLTVAGILGIVGTGLMLSAQADAIGISHFDWAAVIGTRSGRWWLIRLIAIAIATLLIPFRHMLRYRLLRYVGAILSIATLAVVAAGGHAVSGKNMFAGCIATVEHLVAGATWVGALVLLAIIVPAEERWDVAPRVSTVALFSVLVLSVPTSPHGLPPPRRVASLILIATLTPANSAAAHGGTDSDATSNYRTRITDPPDIAGLGVRTVDLDGSVELTWNGAGTVLVLGYENEPFLRFDGTGVSHNLNSPATYLNQDRYANTDIPDDVDAQASPDWELVATTRSCQWHDHRIHWVSPIPPPRVNANPDRPYTIFERWEIPLTVGDRSATIAGDLTWTPPPTTWMWLAAATAIALVCVAALATSRWRLAAVVLAGLGVTAMIVDTIGYVARLDDTTANKATALLYCFLAMAATIRLAIHARRRTPDPTLAMMTVGLILTVMGGLDRVDVRPRSRVTTRRVRTPVPAPATSPATSSPSTSSSPRPAIP